MRSDLMATKTKRWHITRVLVVLALAVSFAALAYVCHVLKTAEYWVAHTYEVRLALAAIQKSLLDLETSARGFAITGKERFLEPLQSAQERLPGEIETARHLTIDNIPLQKRLDELATVARQRAEFSNQIVQARRRSLSAAQALVGTGRGIVLMDRARDCIADMLAAEDVLLTERQARFEGLQLWLYLVAVLAGLSALAVLINSALFFKRYSAALDAANKELTFALEAKDRFLSTISHEVRTPMAGVIGLIEMMHTTALDEEMRSLSLAAMDSCKRLLQILNNMLDASKLNAGAVTLENRNFAVSPVIGDVVQLVAPEADKKGLRVTSTVAPDVPESVYGDELRLRQILHNLVFNALKFTEAGNVHLEVQVLDTTGSTSTLAFVVTDTGIGISAEQQAKLFEPFSQAEDSTARIYGGTGLGLNICRTLVELMGGKIGVDSRLGQGATFWVHIPFRISI